jgi:hypothetical protein
MVRVDVDWVLASEAAWMVRYELINPLKFYILKLKEGLLFAILYNRLNIEDRA